MDLELENAIREWIRQGIKTSGIRTQRDLADETGIPLSTLTGRLADPGTFRLREIVAIGQKIGSLTEYMKGD